jgi:Spy/CpxP family protein refolding chaperone
MIRILLGIAVLLQMSMTASAQSHAPQGHASQGHAPQSHAPYAEMRDRAIKALSEQQVADLKAGKGMGLALPAELNGYPGPIHVLEFADQMNLTGEQRQRTSELFRNMKDEAAPLGQRLIESEAGLDRLFANRTITPATLDTTTNDIARLQGQLRQTHLKYHLAMVDLLSPEQIQRYRQLRGYESQPAGAGQHHKSHH